MLNNVTLNGPSCQQLQHRNRSIASQQASSHVLSRHVLCERLTTVIYWTVVNLGLSASANRSGVLKDQTTPHLSLWSPLAWIFFFPRKRLTNLVLQLSVTVHSKSFLCDFWIGVDINSLSIQNNAATRLFLRHCAVETWLAYFANSANRVAENTYQVENPFQNLILVSAANEVHAFYTTIKFITTYTTACQWSCPETEYLFHTIISY